MKTRFIGTSTWLFFLGATTVLLIGAFAKFEPSNQSANLRDLAIAAPMVLQPGEVSQPPNGLALPPNLSPGLDEIIKLARARVDEGVLLAYVQNSGRAYRPTSDEILYLTDLGVSQKVIAALFPSRPAEPALVAETTQPTPPPSDVAAAADSLPTPVPSLRDVSFTTPATPDNAIASDSLIAPPPPPPQALPPAEQSIAALDPTTSFFYNDLAPYGGWVNLGAQGWFWQPSIVTTTIGWQPYRDRGHWRSTAEGWYWRSDYSWGWAAFHYGRWLNSPRYGWIWSPGRTWGPAWVAWVTSDEYSGWAPLPPGVQLPFAKAPGGGPPWRSILSPSLFTFVRVEDFTASDLVKHAMPASKSISLLKSSRILRNYCGEGDSLHSLGEDIGRIEAAARRPVKEFSLREVSSAKGAVERAGFETLLIYRPKIPASAQPPLNSENSRGQAKALEDANMPAREIPGQDMQFGSANERRLAVMQPGAPPPPAWSMRRFSLPSEPNGWSRQERFPEELPSETAAWQRPQSRFNHDVIVSGGVPPSPTDRNPQRDGQRRVNYEAPAMDHRYSGTSEHVAPMRQTESHPASAPASAPPSASSPNSKK